MIIISFLKRWPLFHTLWIPGRLSSFRSDQLRRVTRRNRLLLLLAASIWVQYTTWIRGGDRQPQHIHIYDWLLASFQQQRNRCHFFIVIFLLQKLLVWQVLNWLWIFKYFLFFDLWLRFHSHQLFFWTNFRHLSCRWNRRSMRVSSLVMRFVHFNFFQF